MGIAARHINGMTLHSLLCLNAKKNNKSNTKSHRDLMAMWEGVDYLFIDEVSMISCQFLCRISEALSLAKGDTRAFGGVNIIFAGDFAQLPPVRETRLYSHIKSHQRAATIQRQQIVFGKLLWLTISTVIILHRPQRQAGSKNKEFLDLLMRLREGRCTAYDYDLLSSRVMRPEMNIDFNDKPW
jgi:hypothetical protein